MTIEGALLSVLTNAAGVAALVSTRIYAVTAPQDDQLPDITFQRIGAEHVHAWGADPGLIRGEWQVDCWGRTYDEAGDVRDAVLAALNRYSGTADSTVVQEVLVMNEFDQHDTEGTPVGRTDTGIYRRTLEFAVWYEE